MIYIKKTEKKTTAVSESGMKIVTINIPNKYVILMQRLLDLKVFPSRSELIRSMIRDWVEYQFFTHEKLQDFIQDADKLLGYRKDKKKDEPKFYLLSNEELVEDEKGHKTRIREWECAPINYEET